MKTYFKSKYQCLIVIAALIPVIIGCKTATFYSTKFDMTSPPTKNVEKYGSHEGIAYFLPKGYIHLVAELQNSGSVTNSNQPTASTNASPAGKAATNSTPPMITEAGSTSVVDTNKLSGTGTNKQVASASPYYKVTIDVILEPDANQMFLLQPQVSAWAHDTYGIAVLNGLLTSVGSTNADQSGGVFLKIAELAGMVATLAGAAENLNLNTNPPALPTRIELTLDPDNYAAEQGQLNSTANLILKITPNFNPTKSAELPVDVEGETNAGIFYRPLLPYNVAVTDKNNHNAQYQTVVLLPNGSPILAVVPRRSTLVTVKTSITFDHGCPTAMSFDRDSPALAWFGLPLDMIKAFLSAPAELVQLKLNFASTNTQLSAQQLADLNNQLAILKQQVAIHQFILTNSPSKNH